MGTAGEGKGQFSEPERIDVDNSDHIYVADTGNTRVGVLWRKLFRPMARICRQKVRWTLDFYRFLS